MHRDMLHSVTDGDESVDHGDCLAARDDLETIDERRVVGVKRVRLASDSRPQRGANQSLYALLCQVLGVETATELAERRSEPALRREASKQRRAIQTKQSHQSIVWKVERDGRVVDVYGTPEALLEGASDDVTGSSRESIDDWFASWSHAVDELAALRRGEAAKFLVDTPSDRVWSVVVQPAGSVSWVIATPLPEKSAVVADLLRENKALRRELKSCRRERELISYEIHDTIAQDALAAQLGLDSLFARSETMELAEEKPEFFRGLLRVRRLVTRALRTSRELIRGLQPDELERKSLRGCVEDLVEELTAEGIQTVLVWQCSESTLGDRVLDRIVLRLVQEGLANIRNHSGAESARVTISDEGTSVQLEIVDDGVGFEADRVDGDRFGLRGMQVRAGVLDGNVDIRSAPGKGTTVRVQLPRYRRKPK